MQATETRDRSGLIACVVLLLEALAFHRHILFRPAKYVIPWDFRYYHLPLAEFVAKSFRQGQLPLWDPFTYCGWPIYAELQTQLFYPPTLITILLSNAWGGHHLTYFLERQIVAHVFLGGIFAWLLLKRIGAGSTGALIGATVFELGPFFASQTQHLCAVDAAAWLPLSWLAVIHLAGVFRWRWLAALSLSLAMSILAGFPAVTAVAFVSCLLLAGALVLCYGGRGETRVETSLDPAGKSACATALLIGCAWAAALSAIQLLPTLELSRLSVARYRADWLGDGGGYPLQSLISILVPNYWRIFQFGDGTYTLPWNPTFLYLYFGWIGLLFILSATLGRKNRYTAPMAIVTLCSLLWMLGEHTPVGLYIYRLLPDVVKTPIFAEYACPAFALGMAVLAGLGAGRLLGQRRLAVQVAVTAACAIELIWVGSGRPMNADTFDREPGISYDRVDGFTEIPATLRELASQTAPHARLDIRNGSMHWVDTARLLETPTSSGDDPLAPERVMTVRRLAGSAGRWERYCEFSSPDSPVYDLLNVRYIISSAPIEGSRLKKAANLPGNFVYENTRFLPRFYLVNRTRQAPSLTAAVGALGDPSFDPRVEAVVEPLPDGRGSVKPRALASGASSVRVVRYESQALELAVDSSTSAYLVTSETNYPGWTALLDGRPQPIYMTNAAFRGLPVPAGHHIVEMEFSPSILIAGAAVSGVSWAALAALSLGNWTSRRKSKPPLTSSPSWANMCV